MIDALDIGKYGLVEGLYGEVFLDEHEPHIIIKGGMLQTNALIHVFFFFFPFALPLDQSASIKRIYGEWFLRIVE